MAFLCYRISHMQLVIRKRLRDSSVIVPIYDSRYVIWLSFPRKMGIPLNWWIKYSVTWRKYVVKFLLSIILWLLIAGCTKQTWVSNIRSKMEKCKFKDLFSIHVLCHHIFRHFRLCFIRAGPYTDPFQVVHAVSNYKKQSYKKQRWI